jgi:DNA-binding protein YbaB
MGRRWDVDWGGGIMDGLYVVAGEAAGGWIRIELASDGRLWDLLLDPQVTTLPAEDLRHGLVSAFRDAQECLAPTSGEQFAEQVADVSATAERRFAEISTALYDISRRAVRAR